MRRRNVLVRRIEAIETLAAVKAICLDKTGTLTFNRMTASEIRCGDHAYFVRDGRVIDEEGRPAQLDQASLLDQLTELAVLCNETEIVREPDGYRLNGSPTESALIQLAIDLGANVFHLRERFPRIAIDYRDEQRLFMTTFHEAEGGQRLASVKGSPEDVLALCGWVAFDGQRRTMSEGDRQAIVNANAQMAEQGQRILGFAYGDLAQGQSNGGQLTWVGLVGLADPLRPGMAELMQVFRRAGINTIMITGDQPRTAQAIARILRLGNGDPIRVADPASFDRLEASMAESAQIPHVFARVTPAQKLQIVKALQRAGLVVAMTGDGVNDSPALMAADVGIAMGLSGSEAAREAAHIVLRDDNLTSLEAAIEQGRTTASNIRKAIRFLLASNLSEILLTIAATAAGLGQPLSPMQLLWVNLISDVLPALALGLEPAEPDVMQAPPRDPLEKIIDWQDFRTLGREAALISGASLAAYGYGISRYGITARARTIAFASLVTAELLHSLSSRSPQHSIFGGERLAPNPVLYGVLALSFAVQSAAMFLPPIQRLLGITPIGMMDGLVALAAGVAPYLANEALKAEIPKAGYVPRGLEPAPASG
jgi:Ca2+-transporting ATPase